MTNTVAAPPVHYAQGYYYAGAAGGTAEYPQIVAGPFEEPPPLLPHCRCWYWNGVAWCLIAIQPVPLEGS